MELSETLGAAALVLVLAALTALVVGPSIWGLVDVSRTPDAAWAATGRKKGTWIAVFAIGLWMWFVGIPTAILYLGKVRPELRRISAAQGATLARTSLGSKRLWVVVALVLSPLWLLGTWAYVTHGHEEFFDKTLAERANAVCADAKDEQDGLPSLPNSPTFDERADAVERTIPIYKEMLGRLRALEAPGENTAYDEWLRHWRKFIEVGVTYADAIRTEDPAVFEPAGNAGDEPATEMNSIARANDMHACFF